MYLMKDGQVKTHTHKKKKKMGGQQCDKRRNPQNQKDWMAEVKVD